MVPSLVKKIGARFTIGTGLMLTALAFLVMSTWTSDMNYWQLFGTMFVMMLGITFAMTPGTNILMASVPRNRSGMGSAMNDTTRELGGALGVAILGAILSATYTGKIAGTVSHFPEQVRVGLESSLAVALQVAEGLGDAADEVVAAAMDAFMAGMNSASLVAAVIIFVAALIALFGLPKHTSKTDDII